MKKINRDVKVDRKCHWGHHNKRISKPCHGLTAWYMRRLVLEWPPSLSPNVEWPLGKKSLCLSASAWWHSPLDSVWSKLVWSAPLDQRHPPRIAWWKTCPVLKSLYELTSTFPRVTTTTTDLLPVPWCVVWYVHFQYSIPIESELVFFILQNLLDSPIDVRIELWERKKRIKKSPSGFPPYRPTGCTHVDLSSMPGCDSN